MARRVELPGKTFAANLEAAREAHGWTKSELAQRSGLNLAAVSRLEAGQRQPRLPSILVLSAALGMTGSELVEGL